MRQAAWFVGLIAGIVPAFAAEPAIDFDRQIRPIFSDNCYTCHGPDGKQRMAGLRLDNKEGAFAPRGKSAAIVPGDSARSLVYLRISEPDPKRRMPPSFSGHTLSEKQIGLIKQWIDSGAEWRRHWAFEPPQRPDLPPVKRQDWVRNPIDRFVLARLEKEGLQPSPEADRATLLRRLSFDLIGLPPTIAEIQAYLSDKSAGAYERQVERLLASPHYGERMAMPWMDLARYADTHGYHIDSERAQWPWRDWVIRAFNSNMPYDRFTVEQIAGDLIPGATRDQITASAFNRNHMINYEGGAIPEEYRVEYVADRVDATSTTWLGLTMGCARCHDHKYDPIKQSEYYRFFAFFNSIDEKGLDGKEGNAKPFLSLASAAQEKELADLNARIAGLQADLTDEKIGPALEAWKAQQRAGLENAEPASLRAGLLAHYEMKGRFADTSGNDRHGRLVRGETGVVQTPVGEQLEFFGDNYADLGSFDLGDVFTIAFWLRVGATKADLGQNNPHTSVLRQGNRVELWYDEFQPMPHLRRGARLHIEMPGVHLRTRDRLVYGEDYHVMVRRSDRLTIYLNGREVPTVSETPSLAAQLQPAGRFEIGLRQSRDDRKGFRGRLSDLRFYNRLLEPAEANYIAVDRPMAELLAVVDGKLSKEQQAAIRRHFLEHDAPQPLREDDAELNRLLAAKLRLTDEIPTVMVMQEAAKPRDTFVLARGDYRNHGEKVTPGVPAFLPPLPAGTKPDRLALAKWVVDPDNPLTARVAVNHFWQNYFGIGLVKTSENFGSQGEPPSHPELLDWLATEFVRTGWDVKALQRLIVTSATYRQTSKASLELIEKDAENRLLARMSRFRLPAEMIRDNALAVSGLLNPQIGGKSVYPYQPPGLWEEIARGEIFSAQVYEPSHGADLYRRSMYWFWKRTSPPPSLTAFDAPDREKCQARRLPTNTPLQALVLMNDPTLIEAARHLAQSVLEEAGGNPQRRTQMAFRQVTGRAPDARETAVLSDLARRQLERYRHDRAAAEKLLSIGESPCNKKLDTAELAAWTNTVSVMLSMDETITKE